MQLPIIRFSARGAGQRCRPCAWPHTDHPFGRGMSSHADDQVAIHIRRLGARSPWPSPSRSVIPTVNPVRCNGLKVAVGRGSRRCRERTSGRRLL